MGRMTMTLTEFASKGGKARAAKLTPQKRARIARKAAKARWSKVVQNAPMAAETPA